MKLKFKKLVAFVFAIIGLTIAGCFGGSNSSSSSNSSSIGSTSSSSSSVKKGVVPTYTGMTISRNYVGNTTSQVIFDEEGKEIIPLNGNDDDPNVNYDSHGRPHYNSGNKNNEKEEIDKDVEELEDLVVLTDDTFRYYVTKGEIFTIEVHLENPNDYEIQSFTLNGQKYANYMFKEGSTMELLLLDVQAPFTSGHLEYTIDAIKYIDGTEIKDVKIGGDKTVKAGVKYENEPTARIISTNIKDTSVTIDFELTDIENLIKDNEIVFYLSDGEKIVNRKTISIDSTTVTFTDLNMGKLYQYGIFTSYDLVDGENVKERCLIKDTFTTLKSYTFKNVVVDKESVDFELDTYGSNGTLKYIALFDADNDYPFVKEVNDLSLRRFDGLLSNHNYAMKVLFEYSLNGEIIEETDVVEFKTLEKVTPTLSVTNLNVYSDYVEFEPLVTDIDNTGSLTNIELYKDNVLVDSKTDLTDYCFYGLLSSNKYELVLKYTYNLNDGGNDRVLEVRQEFTTLGKLRPTVSIESIMPMYDGVTFDILVNDVDNVGELSKVELYLNNELVQSLYDLNNFEFLNLLANTEYEIRVTYEYDLNTGEGIQELVVSETFVTLNYKEPSIDFVRDEEAINGTQELEYALNENGVSYKIVGFGTFRGDKVVLGGYYNDLPITSVDYQALSGCTWIKEVVILDTITNIGADAFIGTSVEKVFFENDVPPSLGNNIFGTNKPNVYVLDDAYNLYKDINNSNWIINIVEENLLFNFSDYEVSYDEFFNGSYDDEITSTSIKFSLEVDDADEIGYVVNIYLYDSNNTLVTSKENVSSLENIVFDNLEYNSSYVIKVMFEYDLLDGTGSKQKEISRSFKTLKHTITGITFEDATFSYDGNEHSIYIEGDLPSGVTVSYENNGKIKEGTYTVIATFNDSTGNYIIPNSLEATITIVKDGKYHDVVFDYGNNVTSTFVVEMENIFLQFQKYLIKKVIQEFGITI